MPIRNQGASCYLFSILLFLSSSAVFAETPIWQGPYMGAYLGGGFGSGTVYTNVGAVTDTSYFSTFADINEVNNAGTSKQHANSPMLGIEMGHDWVWKQMVYGVAVDYGALLLNSSHSVNGALYPDNSDTYSISTGMSTNWLFTFRGRLGYEMILRWPSFFYLTGGMAITQTKVTNNFSDNSPLAGLASGASPTENQIGWTAGAGLEFLVRTHLSFDLEYLYVHIPSIPITSFISNQQAGFGVPRLSLTSPFSTTEPFSVSVVKVGLNYRFSE